MSTTTITAANAPEELNIKLVAGEMKLYSSFIPVLAGGDYTVTVKQKLELSGHKSVDLETVKQFRITAPRYSLAPGDIYSSFPHPGHGEDAKVLPHVLLSDPHLPWARDLNLTPAARDHPWMGILSFAPPELQPGIPSILSKYQSNPNLSYVHPSPTMSYNLQLGHLWALRNDIALPLNSQEMDKQDMFRPLGEKSSDFVDAVFLPYEMFEKLFCEGDGPSRKISLRKFQYMSHVRMINSVGTIVASNGGPGNTQYGVVIGPRSGPVEADAFVTDLKQPVPMIAHLFSLEGIQSLSLDYAKSKGYVGLISLHSWVYESLPPNSDNYYKALKELGENIQPLRLSNENLKSITTQPELDGDQATWLKDRLEAGYSFIRFRPSTGEQTAGVFRGALTPKLSDVTTLPKTSNVGSDMQIIDCQTGVPDLTYHLAWELGRSLGSSDAVFSAAMLRLRTRINLDAQDRARGGTSQAHEEIFKNIQQEREGDRTFIQKENRDRKAHNTLRRWNKREILPLDPEEEETDLKADQDIIPEIQKATTRICQDIELPTGTGQVVTAEQFKLIAETSAAEKSTDKEPKPPNSSSWTVIVKWIVEKLMLLNIPNIYLYPEPLALPEEAFRTFHIDEVWMDAFLDGALSVANHRFFDEIDYIRNELKKNLNIELRKPVHQIPKWGFIIRSKVVLAFPDLRIQAPWIDKNEKRQEIARMQRLAPDTLLCLFDRQPGDGSFDPNHPIVIKEPPHQQKFSVGDNLNIKGLEITYRLLPTATTPNAQSEAKKKSGNTLIRWDRMASKGKAAPGVPYEPPAIYDWKTRCLNSAVFADTCFTFSKIILENELFNAPQPGSALTGIQLNDEPMTLNVSMPAVDAFTAKSEPGQRTLPTMDYEPLGDSALSGHKYATAVSLTEPFPRKSNFPFPRIRQVNPPPKLKFRVAAKEVIARPQTSQTAGAAIASQLEKAVFSLHEYGCNIPVGNAGATDLVFSISARKYVPSDIALKSLTVIIPGGKNRTDLLRVTRKDATKLTVLPSAQFIGKGSRWLAVSRECDALVEDFIPHLTTTQGTLSGPLPTTTLAVRVVPRGKVRPLAEMPELSFVLNGVELNDMASADVKIIFQEEYSVRIESGEQLQVLWKRTDTIHNCLKVEKQRGL
ncbi:hypothetical protein ABW20_dc0109454 [Dactylellina cionopaga]|nr:hypothetical protein ABW20_dc0109454 [Dactylellina cionopaga]